MKKDYLSRKENIILCAIDIIHELGIHELSTREIARRQGVTEASLYKHFKNKQELIVDVLQYSTRYDDSIMETIKNNKPSAKEGILFLAKSYAEIYENYPAITALIHSYEVLLHDETYANIIKKDIQKKYVFLQALLREGQAQGEIAKNFESESFTDIIMALFFHLTFKWRLQNYEFSLKDRLLRDIKILLDGKNVRTHKEEK